MKSLIIVLLLATPCAAQPTVFDHFTPAFSLTNAQHAADAISLATVSLALTLDTHASWTNPQRGRAFGLQAARLGTTYGSVLLLKRLVNRRRPCFPDCGLDIDASFPSMHTAFAFQAVGGPRLAFTLPLSISTGGLRVAAKKHYLTDVLAGSAIGLATSRIR